MTTNITTVGDRRKIPVTGITDQDGNPVDPPTLKLLVKSPDGALTTYTYGVGVVIVKDAGVGNYHAYIPLTQRGRWAYDWIALDAQAVGLFSEGRTFYVSDQKTA